MDETLTASMIFEKADMRRVNSQESPSPRKKQFKNMYKHRGQEIRGSFDLN